MLLPSLGCLPLCCFAITGAKEPSGVGPSTAAAAEGLSGTNWGVGGGAGPADSSTTTGLHLSGRQRMRVSVQGSIHCLVCSHPGHESCGFCPLSQVIKALLRLMTSEVDTQDVFLAAGGIPLLVGLMRQEVGQVHSRLMGSLVNLLVVAVVGNPRAQDAVRNCGGVEMLLSALAGLMHPGRGDVHQLRVSLLTALTVSIAGNTANKLAFREQGGLATLVGMLNQLAGSAGPEDVEDGEQLVAAELELLCACLPECPGNQVMLHSLGMTELLLLQLSQPSGNTALQRLLTTALSLMADEQPLVQEMVVSAQLIPVLMERVRHPTSNQTMQVRQGLMGIVIGWWSGIHCLWIDPIVCVVGLT